MLWALGFLVASVVTAAPPSRISESLQSGRTFQLSGNTHPLTAVLPDKGSVPGETPLSRITIDFKMSQTQQAALTQLLAEQQNPSSPQYHKWLTPEQFGEQFGMSSSDMAKVENWLRNLGFTDVQVSRSRNAISMSGTVALAQYAFQTPIHNFDRNGTLYYANTTDPVLPAALQGIAGSVRGLSNLRPRPRAKARPRFYAGTSGNFIAPGDFATIYDLTPLYNAGINGSGQKIAIAGQTDIQNFDIEAFQRAAGLTVQDPTVILDGRDPGLVSSDLDEAELDVEWSGAVARGATIVYVNSQDALGSAIYAIQNQVANVLSLTYGECEAQTGTSEMTTLNAAFQQANAQGMTVIAASGDSGAADCDAGSDPNTIVQSANQGLAVDFPASSPYVTGMGGSSLNENGGNYWATTNGSNGGSALSYIPEMAWNNTCSVGAASASDCAGAQTFGLSATGGGASSSFTKPSWQTGAGVPADGWRDVPDVSFAADPNHDGYIICETPPSKTVPVTTSSCTNGTFASASQQLSIVGGTSISSPTFAGIVALIDQMTGSAQGNINPRLYALASLMPDVFHDITVGNNIVPCDAQSADCSNGILGYNATAGYDQVTGLGSVDANNLVQNFAPSYTLSVSPSTLTVGNSSSAASTVTVSAVGGFTGTVTFSCSVPSTLSNTTCSVPGSVTGSGSTTVTISNNTSSSVQTPVRVYPPASGSNLLLLLTAFGLLLGAGGGAARKNARLLWGATALLSAGLMTGCGGGSTSSSSSLTQTATVTGTVTVTAVSTATSLSNSITKTITISVTEP